MSDYYAEAIAKELEGLGDALYSKTTSSTQIFIETKFGSYIKKSYKKKNGMTANNALLLEKINKIIQGSDNEEDKEIKITMPQLVSYLIRNELKEAPIKRAKAKAKK